MNLVLILLLGGLMHATRSFSAERTPGSTGTALALGYILLTAFFAGGIFKQLRLPKLTGYLIAGLVVGPGALDLVSTAMVENLKIVNGMAVALIALTAGTDLELRSMRPFFRSIQSITLIGVVFGALALSAAVFSARDLLPFMSAMSLSQATAVSLVLGVVMIAQSPAVVVALRDEMRAEGPVARTVLGVVVLGDMVVIFLFAAVSAIAKSVFRASNEAPGALSLLAWELVGSLLAGVVIGSVLGLYLGRVKAGAGLFLLAVTFVIAEVGQRLHFDPLLVALSAGIFIRNATRSGDRLHSEVVAPALPVYILFFAVAGANLHLDVLSVIGPAAVLFVIVRGTVLYYGARMGARLAGAPPTVQRYAGFGLLPQAGLALALSTLFAKTFPELGVEAGALTLGVVAINELAAPILYRVALIRCGEADQGEERGSTLPSDASTAIDHPR